MKMNHCFFAPQVFRHNKPYFQKLQNRADLRQRSISDKIYHLLKLDNFNFIHLHYYMISKIIHHNNN